MYVITKPSGYEHITPEDILIIKTPTVDFTGKEIKKIDSILKKEPAFGLSEIIRIF